MYTSKQIDLDISDNQRILAKASENKANKHILKATKLEFSRDMQRMRRKELKSLRKLKKGLIAVVIIEALALGYFCYKSVITSRASEPTRIEQSLDDLDGLKSQENQKETLKEYPSLSTSSNSSSKKDLEILSRIICGEAQSYSDELQLAVGSVFLNRVKDSRFPNTFEEVAFQKRQYACTKDGNYYRQPTEKNIANAKYLLENGSVLPENVVFQAEFKQGKGVYKTIEVGKRRKMYFCY